MNINLDIRPYRPDDKSRLLNIWRAASAVGHPFFTEDQLDQQADAVRDVYLPKAENWVAVMDGTPVGFIGLLGQFVGGLFVDPASHSRGIGRALVADAAEMKGHLELEVYARNSRALSFYQRLGFIEVSRRDTDDHGFPFELVRLER
jgi:ribosomal protein S18 acetylase RimI-like enzyme